MEIGLLILLFAVSTYAMLAKKLSTTIITAPMVFLGMGFIVSQLGLIHVEDAHETVYLIAEISLVVLLFLDASQINLRRLKRQNTWPLRMLLLGLPLSILIGTGFAYLFFPEWPWPMLALIAAILAPTDAALGQAVISNESVPTNERQSLSVESGLNDGLALPIILFFASIVAMEIGSEANGTSWLMFGFNQIFVGIFVGLLMGWLSGRLFLYSEAKQITSSVYEGIGVLALTGISYVMASLLGGNGFIASFVAGLVFGHIVKGHCRFIYQFTESEGQILIWTSFVIIGLGLLPSAIEHLTLPVVGYILVSIFIVRPLAIYLSLLGTKAKTLTRVFMGFFGPRGLATALFALIISKDIIGEYGHSILIVAINAVWISTLIHGIAAAPMADWYGAKIKLLKIKSKAQKKLNNQNQ
ncbi:cation:proton antiporter [Colwellia sp. 4_MG-2023]|jgi:NhaP-type Na+/H+ or K+/H+ antiporter|uniref:cation:proton antiporter n=1 Tax=unclassified Colwellia TaxID=196834 RepID=UPI001C09582D|nr:MULTISPECIES: cation:proton antiporter [unclassified Colwellia]MBU2923440.1 cation:proton antiporter [Colwellia sp. C2M11]MDO6489092.1 cation:proton antiporter [Colwellia sp. 6_MG-2023]MDO6508120.1 cation:proton antiporter [Colwellia sp. 5_MG-2023]MDO6556856.1 cation:proton antiporter [Colwellia sp. 4_MG-2023]MDO6653800.1 cation:proton antiporter [Colwellia sp. 3_MG-2023]